MLGPRTAWEPSAAHVCPSTPRVGAPGGARGQAGADPRNDPTAADQLSSFRGPLYSKTLDRVPGKIYWCVGDSPEQLLECTNP
jgi:hypothetical protein